LREFFDGAVSYLNPLGARNSTTSFSKGELSVNPLGGAALTPRRAGDR